MRFLADGPVIPAHLLEQQQLGNVIFFCGAGLSRPAGLPDFQGLTKAIIERLGADRARRALAEGASLDRVFNLLHRDFGRQEIDGEIYRLLQTPGKPKVTHHQCVLSLSRGADGKAQVVTTNFDLLFERADRSVRSIVAPHLPDLEIVPRFDGVVYLHGKLCKPDPGATSGYIIGGSDFGRAYLSDAWAARFVRSLRERYTLVFLG